ncbi:MAG: 16S rRNA (uracil(1498)-N(3))-methyltransferase [Muribaculaceae bacterium]|nr:16S rRNA (uracil(1498)-N(3))-methyltransferase [Muribaculaceae bacterium]
MIRFYAPEIETTHTLPESDSGHCVRVLRMREGDELEVVDGLGTLYRCVLLDPHPKRASLEILSSTPLPKVWHGNITVAIAPTKNNDRMEWLVEKLTEIGVDRIIPLRCRYSERKDINVDRLEKIAVSAMKQSLKAVLPQIDPMTPFNRFLADNTSGQRFIAYCDPTIPRLLFAKEYRPFTDTIILIGPEGDFSGDEIRAALDLGWTPVTLGDNRLRTETAALVACDTCHIINQLNS